MIGSSVVPGLPKRCVTPSSLSSARNAERPVMRFMEALSFPRASLSGWGHHDQLLTDRAMEPGHNCFAAKRAVPPPPVLPNLIFDTDSCPRRSGSAITHHTGLLRLLPSRLRKTRRLVPDGHQFVSTNINPRTRYFKQK